MAFIRLWCFPCRVILLSVFIINGCCILSVHFCTYWCDHIIFVLYFVNQCGISHRVICIRGTTLIPLEWTPLDWCCVKYYLFHVSQYLICWYFASGFIRGTVLLCLCVCASPARFGSRIILDSWNVLGSTASSSHFRKRLRRIDIQSPFNTWCNSLVKPSGPAF